MPIDTNKKIIFVHIPKNAGTTINALCDFKGVSMGIFSKHMTLGQMLQVIKDPEAYIKFSVVRNPWDRIVSAYEYTVKMAKSYGIRFNHYITFATFVQIIYRTKNFPQLRITQTEYITSRNNTVDFLGRYERIEETFEFIKDNIPGLNMYTIIPKLNATVETSRSYANYYNPETFKIVTILFEKDIQNFGYQFEGNLPVNLSPMVQPLASTDLDAFHLTILTIAHLYQNIEIEIALLCTNIDFVNIEVILIGVLLVFFFTVTSRVNANLNKSSL